MNRLIEIASMMKVEQVRIMNIMTSILGGLLNKAWALLDYKTRQKIKLLKNKLDSLEINPRLIRKLQKEVEEILKVNPSKSLIRKWIGYKYRLNIIKKSYPELRILKALERDAEIWKRSQGHIKDSRLTAFEIDRLHEIAEYNEFASFILKSTKLKKALFNWTLLDGNDPAPFIEFPETTDRLIQSNLSQRIGRLGGKDLKIKQAKHKYLTLPFEGQELSIMNPQSQVEFAHGLILTIREILEIFKNKEYEGGILEFMKEGIINYSPSGMGQLENGSVVPFSVRIKKWWEKLPILEILTESEVVNRYGVVPHSGEWIASAASTRGSLNLDFNKTHAFIEIAVPQGNGEYRIFDFGKFAVRFPKTILDMIKMFCQNVQATIAYPDENVFYTFREKAYHPFVLSNEEGELLMNEIKNDIEKSRQGNMIYQIESENCAKWVHNKLSAVIGAYRMPHLFYMPLLETEPNGFVKWAFGQIKKLPMNLQVPVLAMLHLPLGSFQETVVEEEGKLVIKSLKDHDFFDHGHVYLPALLNHKRQELAEALAISMERAAWNVRKIVEYVEIITVLAFGHKSLSYFKWTFLRSASLARVFLIPKSSS